MIFNCEHSISYLHCFIWQIQKHLVRKKEMYINLQPQKCSWHQPDQEGTRRGYHQRIHSWEETYKLYWPPKMSLT